MEDSAIIEKIPRITSILIAANIIVFLIAELFFGSTLDTSVLVKCGGAYVPLISDGQYWRLFTAMFLHSGIRHLLNNLLLLAILGSVLEHRLGNVRYLFLYLFSGLSANVLCWKLYVLHQEYVVAVGASGAIFAVMGGLIWILLRNSGHVEGLSLRSMLIMLALSLYFGFTTTGVSNEAHLFGLVIGFILCIILYHPHKEEKTYV